MKTTQKLALFAALLVSGFTSHAITNTAIAISGTNLILSWSSYGYENYLVQYRQTLDPSDSWSALTNAYPANSTNRTTFTIYGVVPLQGGSGSSFSSGSGSTPSPNFFRSSTMAMTTEPLAVPVDGSGGAVPVAIFPPGFDFSNFNIFDPMSGESVSGIGYTTPLLQERVLLTQDALQPLDNTPDDSPAPQTGFYRVFHIPDWLADFSGYTFDGPTFIPVDYAAPDVDVDYVERTTVLIGGQPTDYAQFMPYVINGVTNWGLGIYFDRLPNGTNTMQLLTTVRQSDDLNDQTPCMVFSNAPAAITIGNFITFTNWDDLIWNNTNYTFRAQTVANVDWEIDIYDVYDNFVNYQTGHSSDGNVSWTWNLYDYWGNSRNDDSDPYFYPYITIWQNSSAGGQVQANANDGEPDPMPPVARTYPDIGAWVVAYMDNNFTDGRTNFTGDQPYYSDGIGSIIGAAAVWSIPVEPVPVKFGRAYAQADRNDSWNNLKAYLQEWHFRNFYYFGHGGATGFGGDINTLDNSNNVTGSKTLAGSKAYIADWYVRQNITVNPYSGSHPFRFVFLDGCSGAAGDLPDAFGVPKQQLNDDYYRSPANTRHVRPSAFVGWNTEIGYNWNGWGSIEDLWKFRKDWASQWSLGGFPPGQETLFDALGDARDFNPKWAPPARINATLCIYGYKDLMYRQYNYGGDWP